MAGENKEVAEDIVSDMSGMEVFVQDEYQDEEDSFEDETRLTSSLAEVVRTRYHVAGSPDWNDFHVYPPLTIEEYTTKGHVVRNDFHLETIPPTPFLAKINNSAFEAVKDWPIISGYDSKTADRPQFVKMHGPRLADSGGGKGLTFLTRSVITQSVSMSGLLNIPLSTGCSAVCLFCLESLVGHTFAEADISEHETGEIRMTYEIEGESYTYRGPGKVKVAAYDPENSMVVYIPLQTALGGQFQILAHSLKIISDEYGRATRRTLSD